MHVKVIGRAVLVAASFTSVPLVAKADESGSSFWIPGQYGSFAAIAPEFGISVPVQTYYYAGRADKSLGYGEGQIGFQTVLFGQFVSPTYTSKEKFLGATPSFSVAFFPGWTDASGKFESSTFTGSRSDVNVGFGDIFPEAQLFWTHGNHNWMTYVTGDIPVGSYQPERLANLGLGHGAIDVGGAYTYLNTSSGWEFSATAGLTYNFENLQTNYTSGIDSHLDVGVSHFLNEQLFIGGVGYAYIQLTPDKGQSPELGSFKSRTFGIGPQIGYNFMEKNVAIYTNLRAYAEFDVENRPKGGCVFLTVDVPVSALAKN